MPTKPHTILILLFIILSILILSCKKSNSIEPEEVKPGRRDYEWTVDTMLPTPFNMNTQMWGDAEDNVWAVGDAGDFDKVLWHYDGKKWSAAPNPQFVDPQCIFGFSRNSIWIGGQGTFWHYTGSSWMKTDEIKVEGFPFIAIFDIWGESPDNLYAAAGAYKGTGGVSKALLVHYDGKSWNLLNIPEVKGSFNSIRRDIKGSGLYFIQNFYWDELNPTVCKVFVFDGKNLKEIYKGQDNKKEGSGVYLVDQKVYLRLGEKLYNYKDGNLVLWKDVSSTNYMGRLWGRSENDFFYLSTDEGIGHFNGSDFITLYKNFFPVYSACITEKTVFFLSYDSKMRALFLKGKLK